MRATTPILIVEDDRDIRATLAEALEDEGYPVIAAQDGLDALERLRSATALPRIILLDLMMPRMNGAEFRRALLADTALSQIPIVVITADAQAHSKAAALGAKASLRKPIKLDVLFDTVSRVLEAEIEH